MAEASEEGGSLGEPRMFAAATLRAGPRMVDLFCGCGGFALGARSAGFGAEIAFDVDPVLTSSFGRNFPGSELVLADLSQVSGSSITARIGRDVLGAFGGPPCQAFSDMGHRRADDPRRSLLGHFFRIVAELRPAFFVMENVRGLGYADTRPVLDAALSLVAGRYDIVGPVVLDAADYGAATRRRRLFVIGYDPRRCDPLTLEDLAGARSRPATVRDAISDLATATSQGIFEAFDLWKLQKRRAGNAYRDALVAPDRVVTGLRPTHHSTEVTRRFSALAPGSIDPIGRHPRLAWSGQCPTLRAGTGSDRGSYQSVRPVHPKEPRVITVREAARLQGFPDRFLFHPTVWHSFRMIGNSVSPIIARRLFSLLAKRTDVAGPRLLAAE